MIIDNLIIEGISNIEHIHLEIGEINALIAPNGYGKSNVLRDGIDTRTGINLQEIREKCASKGVTLT